jgi:aminomethyltransferase
MPNESRTSLYNWHVSHKARIVPFGGWDMPVQYTGIMEEHNAVRNSVGLFDISHMARVAFSGNDVLPVLENVFTNSVSTMRPGQVRYGLVCNNQGGILDDILVYRMPNGFAAVINASNRVKILDWLKVHSAGKDFHAEDQTFHTTMIAIQGPKAVEHVEALFPGAAGLKYYYAMDAKYHGEGCVVSRTGYTGEDGYEVSVPNKLGVTLWEEFIQRGALPCGLGARDTLRLEAAMPLYGHELNETIDPLAAGLGWAVKFDKGEFLGRYAMNSADMGRSLRIGLELEGKRAAREGSAILSTDGMAVGVVTSGSFVPHLQKSIAMGYVPLANSAVGSSLLVDFRGTTLPATVVKMPFYSRKK